MQNKIENLMDDFNVDEELQLRLMDTQRTLNRLKKIVRSLLLISRIENEQFNRSESWNAKELFESVREEIGHRMEERFISMTIDLNPETTWNHINRDLLFQLVYNLINNSIKYNKDLGTIRVSEQYSFGNPYQLIIQDSGIGISETELPTIFNRFRKINTGEGSGYGLGLAIVKSIADYHDISISVDSVPGEGTRFVLTFPKHVISGQIRNLSAS
jgi:two-component system, OmpR family, sensor histidine kinase ArlS